MAKQSQPKATKLQKQFVTKIIPNGKCSHGIDRLLIMVPHDEAHTLAEFEGKQIKVTVECI